MRRAQLSDAGRDKLLGLTRHRCILRRKRTIDQRQFLTVKSPMAALVATPPAAVVEGDGAQPRPEAGFILERFQLQKSRQNRILHQVVSGISVSRVMQAQQEERVVVLSHQLLERACVPQEIPCRRLSISHLEATPIAWFHPYRSTMDGCITRALTQLFSLPRIR